jgi:hypothetical protein
MDINISNNKYSNVNVTNKTRLYNFNLGNYDNIVYINNIKTETNNNLTLDKSNSTYIIRDTNSNNYKKYITEIIKSTKSTFVSYNHNLKKNDIIKLYNIERLHPDTEININLLKSNLQNTDVTYKVLNVTRNTFTLITFNNSDSSLNNITDILLTSYNNITSGYFELVHTKTSNEILSKSLNININSDNDSTNDDYGIYYNVIIDSSINQLTINTLNNDRFNGFVLFNNKDIIGPDYLESASNKSTLNIGNIDLENSKLELINIEKNNWFIKCNIPNNTIKYVLTYDTNINNYKINNNELSLLEFYKNYTYIIDISDVNLKDYLFVILNSNNIHYYKNITKFGEMGHENSFIKIYVNHDETVDNIYTLKYKSQKTNNIFNFVSLYIIKDIPIYFS